MQKRFAIAVMLLAALFSLHALALHLVPVSTDAAKLGTSLPSELEVRLDTMTVYITHEPTINRIANILLAQTARRVRTHEVRREQRLLVFDYGYKGKTVIVYTDGSAIILRDKAEVRNRIDTPLPLVAHLRPSMGRSMASI